MSGLAQPVADFHVTLGRVAGRCLAFAHRPPYVEPGQILHLEQPHGKAKVLHGRVHVPGHGPILKHVIAFASVCRHDPVGDEAVANTGQHGDLAQFAGKGHGSGQHVVTKAVRHDDLEQFHDVRGRKEVQANHPRRVPRRRRQGVDVQVRRVGGQNSPGLHNGIKPGQHVQLDGHVLENRLDHQIRIGQGTKIGIRIKAFQHQRVALGVDQPARQAALQDRQHPCAPRFGRGVIAFDHLHRQPGQQARRRDARPHGAPANDAHRAKGAWGPVLDALDTGRVAFGKEHVAQCLCLRRGAQVQEGLPLCHQGFGGGQGQGPAQRRNRRLGRLLFPGFPVDPLHLGFQRVGIGGNTGRALRQRHGPGLRGHPQGQRNGVVQQIPVGQRIDQPDSQRLLRADRFAARDHLQRKRRIDQTRQTHRAAAAWDQAKRHFGQSHPRIARSDPVAAGQRGFQTAPKGGAMDRRHPGFARRFQPDQHVRQHRWDHRLVEFANVGASDEGPPCTGQHDRLHGIVGLGGVQRFQQPVAHHLPDRVDRRIVDPDKRHGAPVAPTDAHLRCPFQSMTA